MVKKKKVKDFFVSVLGPINNATNLSALDLYLKKKTSSGLFLHGLLISYLGIDGWGASLISKVHQEAKRHPALPVLESQPRAERWKHAAFSA